jgi:arylsulfatase A-like enzyme
MPQTLGALRIVRRVARFAWIPLLGIAACAPREPARAPDLVLISIDSLRPDHLGSYGYAKPTSPRLDAFAAESIRFTQAVSTTSWTLPAHAALFTGLYDAAHGVVARDLALSEVHATLAEQLRDAGYRTLGAYSGPLLHPRFGVAQGFERWEACMDPVRAEGAPEGAEQTSPCLVARAREWLAEADQRPLFLFLHFFDVHYDYAPPPEYSAIFDPDYQGTTDFSHTMGNDAISARMSARDLQHWIARYDGEIRYTDEHVGRVFDALAESGRYANAAIVVIADHGDEFFEHGSKGHRQSLFEEVLRIPLVLKLPGGAGAGRVVKEQVRLIDLYPTLSTLAALPAPSVQGRDLFPLLAGAPWTPSAALGELYHREGRWLALRFPDKKLLVHERGGARMHDLNTDPSESAPLANARHERAMRERLDRAVRESERLRRERGLEALRLGELAPELEARLEALGYLDRVASP